MALRLADRGLDVILTYNSKDEAQKVVTLIEKNGQKAAALQLDTADLNGFNSFIERLKEVLSSKCNTEYLDYLINNAGVGLYAPIGEITEDLFDKLLNIHFKGVLFLTQHVLPLLNDGGGIVNISTGTARFSVPGSATY